MNITEKFFGIARVYDSGTNFLTVGRIKILPDFNFPKMYMYYILLDCKLFGDNKYWTYSFVHTTCKKQH